MLKRMEVTLLSCILCMVLLTGCYPMSRETGSSSKDWESLLAELKETAPNELPEHLEAEVSEYLKIDAIVETYSELMEYAAPNVEMSLHVYDQHETVDTLLKYMGNPEVVGWKEVVKDDEFYPDGRPVSFYEATLPSVNPEISANAVQARDFYFFVWNTDDSPFCDMFGNRGNYATHSLNRIEGYADDTDLSFATRADVDTMIAECMDELGLAYRPWEQHVCTSEDLKDKAEAYEEQYKDDEFYMSFLHTDISEEAGVYFRAFCQYFNDIPVIPYYVNSGEITGNPWYGRTYAYCVYGQDGIEDFSTYGAMDYVGTKDTQNLISFGDALELYVNARNSAAVSEQHTIKRAGLYYLPQQTQVEGYVFEAKPVWVFVCDKADPWEGESRYMVIYDAVTGEKIM